MLSLLKIWKHLWPQIKKYKWSYYFVYIINSVRTVLLTILTPLIFKEIIDLISDYSTSRSLVESNLLHLIFIFTLLIIGGFITGRISGFVITYFQTNVIRELHNYAFEKLTRQSHKFFTNQFSGSLVAKAKRLVRGFEHMHDIFVWDFTQISITLLGVFYVLFIEAPSIAKIFLVWSIFYIFISVLFIKYKIKYDLLEAEADSRVSGSLSDVISNVFNVKIFSARKREISFYEKVTFEEHRYRSKAWLFGNISDGVQGILMGGVHILVLYQLANGWIEGTVSTGVFVLVETYMLSLFDKLWNLSKAMTRFVKSLTDVKEITDVFEQIPEILDPENAETSRISKGAIAVDNIFFGYLDNQGVFSDFSFEIKSGERVGLVGHSGSGKSTLTKLLLRFADVQKGSIQIDGQNIKNITQDDLRRGISYVPQESILFHRTLRENISYGDPDATEEKIIEASKKAHAHDFIKDLPLGYDTLVGERGIKLSGGERQRVAIARAMLKKSPILILDEATSSLDSISEKYIQESFAELMKGRTTIVIAHRLSTVQKLDRIIVLDKGKIVEEGTHNELLDKKGYYFELWSHQTGGFLSE